MGRDRHFQAILPLRGKILNVEKTRLDRGARQRGDQGDDYGVRLRRGRRVRRSRKLRYDRIVCMTDADVDGSAHPHPDADVLLPLHAPADRAGATFTPLMPPLYKVTYQKTERYCYSDAELDKVMDRNRPRKEAGRAALQGPWRDERRAALDDDDEPRNAHHAARVRRRTRLPPTKL